MRETSLIMSIQLIPPKPVPQPKYEYQKLQYGFGMARGIDTHVMSEESPKSDDIKMKRNN